MLALLFTILTDLIFFNSSLLLCRYVGLDILPPHGMFIVNLLYLISVLAVRPVSYKRFTRMEKVASRSFQTSLLFFSVYALLVKADAAFNINNIFFCIDAVITTGFIFIGRSLSRSIIKALRRAGRGASNVVFVGAGKNLAYLHESLRGYLDKGFIFMGYFNDHDSSNLPRNAKRLGMVSDAIDWMKDNHPDIVYCNLPASREEELQEIIRFCEKNFIHFRAVANVRNYLNRSMAVEMIDDMPVLSIRKEPLDSIQNRIMKRTFDLIFSSIFLVTCFWWIFIIVAIITKITMPGPVFFKQKRNGIRGHEFTMLKFRSMEVNQEADTLQATKDDPRKTKWGNFMRRTNIDELPQFINVFLGDMSIVGPRPHMIKQTEQYSQLIERYMLRHWVRPGITGWAQVTGARGETEELWQMEIRVQRDIWYIEHWSIWLDLRIIVSTITNFIKGDDMAY